MTAPPPLTPPDADLRDFQFMPFDVVRFAQSDLVAFASHEAIVAALLLWGASWHQVPAGSLTNDDRALAKAAGYGRSVDAWAAIRDEALRGFVLCADGRLYHPVVAEKVNASWLGKLKQRHRTYCSAVRMHNSRNPDDQRASPSFEEWLEQGKPETIRRERAPQQTALSLPDPETPVARNNGECCAQQEAETPSYAQQGAMLRATRADVAPPVARLNGSKREGEGEGEGEGDSYASANATATRDADDEKRTWDALGWADALARRAGIPHMRHSDVTRNLDVVREWLNDGIDLARVVEPEIDKFRTNEPDRRLSTLRFFDQSVRAAVAAAEAKSRKGRSTPSTITAPPVAPLRAQDADDDRVRAIRAKLNGKAEHAQDVIALRIEDREDGAVLVITARSSFAASRVDRDLFARLFGSLDVEVVAQ